MSLQRMGCSSARRNRVLAALSVLLAAAAPARAREPWTKSDVIEPAQLAAMLSKPHKPVIFQVGFRTLFYGGHIPGAHYCGPAQDPAGIARLKVCLAKFSNARMIVIYCGCCPMVRCPNVRPAFALIRQMGFTRLKVLDLPNDFATDWIKKGYPTTPPAGVQRTR